ncbi:MAG TPA: DUF1223 domain-containing protein [Terracidiphilus sp.]|nr:DUF1223 domain-containing protein [Terracidiphilus sp.]
MASPSLVTIRLSFAVAITAAWLALSASARPSPPTAPANHQPVLVELFTSEGCSDCPPADALLGRLDATQFIAGAQAIVLSEHVTYWNHQGWRDPFSFDAMDERQRQYSLHFSLDDVYTPQMVVDGAQQFVGSNAAALSQAVAVAVSTPKVQIAIKDANFAEGALRFSVLCAANPGTKLVAALAENATRSEVARGENAGRTLHHVAVVRVLKEFDSNFADGRPLRLSGSGSFTASETSGPLRLVVFLTDRKTGHVVAVAQQIINR